MPPTDRRTTTKRGGFIILPSGDILNPKVKILITADNGTVYTVMDTTTGAAADNFTLKGSVKRPVTDRLGSFSLIIANDNGRFLNVFNGGEIVRIYVDYTNATNLVFYGKVDNAKYGLNETDGFFIELDGRDFPELVDKTITGQEAAATADISISGILYNFYNNITLLFWNGSSWSEAAYTISSDTVSWSPTITNFPTTLINYAYQNKKGWSVIGEICRRANLDCYLEYDESGSRWTLKLLVQNSIQNNAANISYGANLISLDEYGIDNGDTINRVILYGKQESTNIVLLKSENDFTSQANLWIKDKIIQDNNLTTMANVQSRADVELAKGIQVNPQGKMTAVGLHNLKPGDNIPITVPYAGIGGFHKVMEFTHIIGDTFTTSVELSKTLPRVQDLFIGKLDVNEVVNNSTNLNNMSNSYTVYFDEAPSVMTHSNTIEASGKLTLLSGLIGQAVSNIITTDNNVTHCEFRRFENFNTGLDTYEVTNDGGVTWEPYSTASGQVHAFTEPDSQIGFRMTLRRGTSSAPVPAYDSVTMLYKGEIPRTSAITNLPPTATTTSVNVKNAQTASQIQSFQFV